jgi:hypothetical protein
MGHDQHDGTCRVEAKVACLQALRKTGATRLEPATSGVTGRVGHRDVRRRAPLNGPICWSFCHGAADRTAWLSQSKRRLGHERATKSCLYRQRKCRQDIAAVPLVGTNRCRFGVRRMSGAIRRFVSYAGAPMHSRVRTRRRRARNSTPGKTLLVVISFARELPPAASALALRTPRSEQRRSQIDDEGRPGLGTAL